MFAVRRAGAPGGGLHFYRRAQPTPTVPILPKSELICVKFAGR
jgi:hypothetical protein